MGRRSREKGKRWERDVASILRPIFGDDVRRGWQAREGHDAPDVICPHFWVECKVGKRPPLVRALEQAEADAPDGRCPVAVVKQDRQAPVVVMRLDDWADLVEEWWQMRQR